MKRILILAMLIAVVLPVFSQGAVESIVEKGIIGAYKELINFKEVEVVPEEETVLLPEDENKNEEVSAPVEVVSEIADGKEVMMDEPEKEISFPTSSDIEDGFTDVTNYFSDIPEDEVYITSYTHKGIKLAGAFTKDEAVIIIPRGIVPESVSTFTSYLKEESVAFSDVDFSAEIDKLVLTYPEKTMDEIILFCDVLKSEAEKFIDTIALRRSEAVTTIQAPSLIENEVVVAVEVESLVEEEVMMDEPEKEISFPTSSDIEDGFTDVTNYFSDIPEDEVYITSYTHKGIKLAGAFTKDEAVIIIPRGIVPESVSTFTSYLKEESIAFSDVDFSAEIDKLVLTYPEKTMDEIILFCDVLKSEAEKFIDTIALRRSEAATTIPAPSLVENEVVVAVEVESLVEEEESSLSEQTLSIPTGNDALDAPFTRFDDVILKLTESHNDAYEVNFGHNGIKTRGVFTNDTAVLQIPRGITEESIDSFALYLLENYPEFSEVYFSCDFDKLYIDYPDKSMEEIIAFCDLLTSEAEKFIDTIYLSRSQSSAAVITTTSENADDETNSLVPVELNTKKSVFTLSFGFDLGMKGLFTADENSLRFFPTIGGELRLSAWEFLFLEGRGDMFVYKNSSKLIIDGSLSVIGGVSLMGSNFGVVAYGGVSYIFASNNSAFSNGLNYVYGVALEVDFASHIAIRGGYEHFADKNLYNVSIGYRF